MTSYGARIADLASSRYDETALVLAARSGEDTPVSWAELDRRSSQVGHALAKRGTRPGSIVVVALPNSVEHVIAAWGAWKVGSCVLPLRHDLPDWERDRLLAAATPSAVVGEGSNATLSLESTATESTDPLPDVVPERAMAIASSGATGAPKLIVRSFPGVHTPRGLRYQTATAADDRPTVHLVGAPMYHTNGFVVTHTSLMEGERVVLMDRFDAFRAVELIEHYQVTSMVMAPTMLLRIARLPGIEHRDLSSLQAVLQGAAVCPPWVIRKWLDLVGPEHFFVSYGGTEGVGITMCRGDEWLAHPGSVGRGMRAEVRVLDAEQQSVPTGEVGEVYLRPEQEAGPTYEYRGADPARSTPDGFITLGDLGWLDEDGYLYIADRRTDLIVSGGANVYPAEVEAALTEHPAVADVVVVGIPDEEWGHRVHAVVQPTDPAAPPSSAELDAHCRARLAAYKVPRSFELVTAVPRTEAGKVNRGALAQQAAQSSGVSSSAPSGRTTTTSRPR